MSNPILQALGSRGNPQVNQVKQMFDTLRAAKNPQAILNQMIQSNPKMRGVMDYINQNGGDPQKAFYTMARQKGVNPEEILNMLK